MSCCGPLNVVVSGIEIEGGVAESAVGSMSVPQGGGVEDCGVCRRAARRFMVWSGCAGSGNYSVAPESTRHVTAFYYSRLGNTRCYCAAQKRKVTAAKLNCQVGASTRVAAVL